MTAKFVKTILDSNFKGDYYESEKNQFIFYDGFLLEIDDGIKLYRSFSYPVDDLHICLDEAYEQLCFVQGIYNLTGKVPDVEEEFYYDCPFDENRVGFFNIDSEEKLIELINAFKNAIIFNEFEISDIKKIVPNEYEFYISLVKKLSEDFNILIKKGWDIYRDPKGKNEVVRTIINRQGTILITSLLDFSDEINKGLSLSQFKEINPYIGEKYTINKNNEGYTFWQSKFVQEVLSFIRILGLLDENDVYFYETEKGVLEIECSFIKAVVLPVKVTDTEPLNFEFDIYKKQGDLFCDIRDQSSDQLFDLRTLKPDEFEKICVDLLSMQGFKNIVCRGKTNTPDGGVDIEADEEVQRIIGITNKHWIFQCKHMKKQIDRKDITEIPYLLDEFGADGYGVFYSGSFTPATMDRFKTIRKDRKDKDILYWDGDTISRMINNGIVS